MKSLVEQSRRKKHLDIAKGLGILSIIVGHLGSEQINKFVFTYHVPLFFLLSGYFYKKDKNLNKRLEKLIKPYCVTVILIILVEEVKIIFQSILAHSNKSDLVLKAILKWIVAGIYGSGARKDFFNIEIPVVGAVWFLLALCWAQILMKIIFTCHMKSFYRTLIVFIIFAIGVLSSKISWFPLSIQSGMSAFLFVYIGYSYNIFLNNNSINSKNECHHIYFMGKTLKYNTVFMAIIIWIVAIFFSYKNGRMSIVSCIFPNIFINVIGACAGTLVIVKISNLILSFYIISTFLAWIGKNTIIILCVHLIELNFFPWYFYKGFAEYIVIFLGKVFLCCIAAYLINKNKLLKNLFL